MRDIFTPKPSEKETKLMEVTGLAPVVCYDPWFPRSLEAIKQAIFDGNPVLVRLHSGASYPDPEELYLLDLESHAVMIVGFDDAKQAVLIVDPWNQNWGGVLGGKRWLPYADLSTWQVDCSLGMSMVLAPIQVEPELCWDESKNLSIKLQTGFYSPRGTVMDRGNWVITHVEVTCELPYHWESTNIEYKMTGKWVVGDCINLAFPIVSNPKGEGELKLQVHATIKAERPYAFEDRVSGSKTLFVSSAESKSLQETEIYNFA